MDLPLDAQLNYPVDVAVAADGSFYISDSDDNRIRRVGPGGMITTYAGTGNGSSSGDGGPAPVLKSINRAELIWDRTAVFISPSSVVHLFAV